ncbi:hypothetical protein CC86DRAFT_411498 [Ophiobolus disseminans]|uniref:Homeodomain-like protein n=1 Tax=Ophiobolus disseminans TaxID=1469910 RepID=A0A6A6ZJC6_9PLEO|nr:hypothetical protein CC86DRAFT_411498 [Ophiobolus disseminans]
MSKTVKTWSPDEDEILLQQITLLSSQGKAKDWTAIALAVPGRSNKDCRKRWCNHLVGGLRKGPWDPSEDRRLGIGVKEYGAQWPLVAVEVGTRSADQCAKRWHHSLDPSLDRSKWSEEEEDKLFKAVEKHGRAWKQIQTEYFPGRATNNVKNKYVVLTRKRELQVSEDDTQDRPSSSGTPRTRNSGPSSESATPVSTRQDTMPQSPSEDVSIFIHNGAMSLSNNYDAQQFDDSFSLDGYFRTIPAAMDLDVNTADHLATDIDFDIGNTDLMTGLVEPPTTADVNDYLLSSHVESEIDPQSMQVSTGFLQNHSAKLVLTIENPSPDAITGIMGVLVPTKTRFRMEMQ